MNKIVCITGFGWSGSGAYFDLLREYDDINIADNKGYDFEFYLLHDADGIYDLEQKLMIKHNRLESEIAIQRFEHLINYYIKYLSYEKVFNKLFKKLTSNYINELIDYEFYGSTGWEYEYPSNVQKCQIAYNKLIQKIFRNRFTKHIFSNDLISPLYIHLKHLIKVSYKPDNFEQKTKKYIESLIDIINTNKKYPIVFDQIFPPDCPYLFTKYVENPKTIIIRRDPRDTYLLAKCTYSKTTIPIPTNNVNDFIKFYKKIVEESFIDDSDNFLSLQFEDLIYEYEATKLKVESFLGIKEHTRPLTKFIPEVSINNTQLYNKYKGYEDDIKKIEKELPRFLYPFNKYKQSPNNSLQVF